MNDYTFPELLRPTFKAFEQIYVGTFLWQHPDFINKVDIMHKLEAVENSGRYNARLALSKDLEGLPDGESPNVAFRVRKSLVALMNDVDHIKVSTFLIQIFLGHCYSLLEDDGRMEQFRTNPEVQFLKHVRNGCFHGNRFNIVDPVTKGKVWREAKWRGREITLANNGNRVLRDSLDEQDYFLNFGDPILLLQDVCKICNIT